MRNIDARSIIHLLVHRDDWDVIEQIDNWLNVYDNMPTQMRLVVDMRMMGETPKEIGVKLGLSHNHVLTQLNNAKKRFLRLTYERP